MGRARTIGFWEPFAAEALGHLAGHWNVGRHFEAPSQAKQQIKSQFNHRFSVGYCYVTSTITWGEETAVRLAERHTLSGHKVEGWRMIGR
ncbi:MAG: hypothetical protein COB16_10425 [Rhodobacteraceae bacterium]|nr:MAG: hypothetical protein COB16_10425 [Paracoccaceae bacterium]